MQCPSQKSRGSTSSPNSLENRTPPHLEKYHSKKVCNRRRKHLVNNSKEGQELQSRVLRQKGTKIASNMWMETFRNNEMRQERINKGINTKPSSMNRSHLFTQFLFGRLLKEGQVITRHMAQSRHDRNVRLGGVWSTRTHRGDNTGTFLVRNI